MVWVIVIFWGVVRFSKIRTPATFFLHSSSSPASWTWKPVRARSASTLEQTGGAMAGFRSCLRTPRWRCTNVQSTSEYDVVFDASCCWFAICIPEFNRLFVAILIASSLLKNHHLPSYSPRSAPKCHHFWFEYVRSSWMLILTWKHVGICSNLSWFINFSHRNPTVSNKLSPLSTSITAYRHTIFIILTWISSVLNTFKDLLEMIFPVDLLLNNDQTLSYHIYRWYRSLSVWFSHNSAHWFISSLPHNFIKHPNWKDEITKRLHQSKIPIHGSIQYIYSKLPFPFTIPFTINHIKSL